jgi:hypothetical protein
MKSEKSIDTITNTIMARVSGPAVAALLLSLMLVIVKKKQDAKSTARDTSTNARITEMANRVYNHMIELLGFARPLSEQARANLGTNLGKILGVTSLEDFKRLQSQVYDTFAKDSASLLETLVDVVQSIDPTNQDYEDAFAEDS